MSEQNSTTTIVTETHENDFSFDHQHCTALLHAFHQLFIPLSNVLAFTLIPMCPEESDSKYGHLPPRLSTTSIPEFQLGVSYGSYLMGEDDNQSHRNAFEDGVYDKPEPDCPISGEEKYLVSNYSDGEDDAQSVVRCSYCDFEIKFPAVLSPVEMFHSDLVCFVCEERIGDNTMSKILSTTQWTRSTEKSRLWVENAEKIFQELAAMERIDEPASESFLSPFIRNMSTEGPINNASDNSNAKSLWIDDAPETGDEKDTEDHVEKQLRALFVQELVLSTML